MGKYNITEKKEKEAAYRSLVSPRMMDDMQEKILNIIVMQKKYRDKDYSAKKLAEDLGTNTRYISAVVNVRFHMNYTSLPCGRYYATRVPSAAPQAAPRHGG